MLCYLILNTKENNMIGSGKMCRSKIQKFQFRQSDFHCPTYISFVKGNSKIPKNKNRISNLFYLFQIRPCSVQSLNYVFQQNNESFF